MIREERRNGQKSQDDTNEAKLKWLVKDLKTLDRRIILRAKNTGSWLTVQDIIVTSIVLSATEPSNFCAWVIMLPPPTNLQKKVRRLLFVLIHTSRN